MVPTEISVHNQDGKILCESFDDMLYLIEQSDELYIVTWTDHEGCHIYKPKNTASIWSEDLENTIKLFNADYEDASVGQLFWMRLSIVGNNFEHLLLLKNNGLIDDFLFEDMHLPGRILEVITDQEFQQRINVKIVVEN